MLTSASKTQANVSKRKQTQANASKTSQLQLSLSNPLTGTERERGVSGLGRLESGNEGVNAHEQNAPAPNGSPQSSRRETRKRETAAFSDCERQGDGERLHERHPKINPSARDRGGAA